MAGNTDGESIEANHTVTPAFPFSTYIKETAKNACNFHIDHPNDLGTTPEIGGEAEAARIARFGSRYISLDLHEASIGKRRGLAARMFRASGDEALLQRCREKKCFRKENLNVAPPPANKPTSFVDDDVAYFVQRSSAAIESARSLYGSQVLEDIQLGFTKPYGLEESVPELPFVADDATGTEAKAEGPVLSLVISYRHSTPKNGRILNIEPERWPPIIEHIRRVCRSAACTHFRLWTDQILSSRKPAETLRWVSCGILPYTVHPVFYIQSSKEEIASDLQRMWISIEHLVASLGQGIIHCGDFLTEDMLPKEWPANYISIDSGDPSITWNIGLGFQMHVVVRRLCGAIMCGLVRNKALSWASDAQDIINWSSAITSTLLFSAIGHSFSCDDCKAPYGYTSGHRAAALMSTTVPIDPNGESVYCNGNYPRLDVPAVRLKIEGQSWDGFREWVPESCLWGSKHDELRATKKDILSKTKAIVVSDGTERAVAVLQFCYSTPPETTIAVAHLLVGLVTKRKNRSIGTALWSKRFWPVEPLGMWLSFNSLHSHVEDSNALSRMGEIIGASSGLDYRDFSKAKEVTTVNLRRVQW